KQNVMSQSNGAVTHPGVMDQIVWVKKYFDGFGNVFKTEMIGDGRKIAQTSWDESFVNNLRSVRYSLTHFAGEKPIYVRLNYDSQGRTSSIYKDYPNGTSR